MDFEIYLAYKIHDMTEKGEFSAISPDGKAQLINKMEKAYGKEFMDQCKKRRGGG